MKGILKTSTVKAYIDFHKKLNIPFSVILSNYTTRIISLYCDDHYMRGVQPNRVFAAYARVKKDCLRFEVEKISPLSLHYFNSAPFKQDFSTDKIFNIDIKAAYASILYRDGYISSKTFNYIKSLPKMERLTCIGMLAGKKRIYSVNAYGKIMTDEKIVSPTADYFFYCVKRTEQIIRGASHLLGKDFLFSWVDGIYYTATDQAEVNKKLKDYFTSEGMKVTIDELTDFQITHHKRYYNCSYKKQGEPKFLNIPKPEVSFTRKITDYLATKNY